MKLHGSSVLLVALLVRSASSGFVPALADELSEDVSQTQSLSPEQAKSLVEEFKAKGTLPGGANGLYLRGLTSLSVETAVELAKFTGQYLELDGLSSLDTNTVKSLVGFKGHLSISGLTELETDAAKALAESECEVLILNGVTKLSADAAEHVSRFRGKWLYLNGLRAISADTAKKLANFGGEILSLKGLAELSPEAAQGLAAYTGPRSGQVQLASGRLYLDGLTKLSAEAAAKIAAFSGEAMTLGMPEISPEVARELARWNPGRNNPVPGVVGSLQFPNLSSLSLESAKAIADAQCGSLVLGGERFENPAQPRHMTVDAPALQALGGFKGKGKVRFGSSLQAADLPVN